jgi:hypothetical protein
LLTNLICEKKEETIMDLGPDASIRLEEKDEYNHPIEAETNFNESMYINLFDHEQNMGGWFRVGNRPNEGYAEVSYCVYLPDGRVAFMYKKPEIDNNDELNAGGMRFEIIEPFKHLRVTYSGSICLLEDATEMANPKKAFAENPMVKSEVIIDFYGASPIFGGEKINKDGSKYQEKAEESFARAHYEAHMKGEGTIKIGDESWNIKGLGLRDHSWGPRYWQNLYWYRWMPMNFNENFALNLSVVTMANGKQNIWGMVLETNEQGEKHYVDIVDGSITSDYDDNYYQKGMTIIAKTKNNEYKVTGKTLSLIPLRNRRQSPNGEMLNTRITEAMTEYQCNGLRGMGMSEYLDQIVDGEPVGKAC